MRNFITVSVSLVLGASWLTAAKGPGQRRDYWELVDPKTNRVLGDYLTMEGMSNDPSEVAVYTRLILEGLKCSPAGGAGTQRKYPADQTPGAARPLPCKFQKLYVDQAADGSPSGRALATAVKKALAKSGSLKLVDDRTEADAVFACRDELNEIAASRARAQLAADAASGKRRRYIAYLVDTDCDNRKSDLTYSAGPGETQQETASSPWVSLAPYFARTVYYLAAQKHDPSTCDITAEVYGLRLTSAQSEDLDGLTERDQASYIRGHGTRLREATSDAAYGVAQVSWTGQDSE